MLAGVPPASARADVLGVGGEDLPLGASEHVGHREQRPVLLGPGGQGQAVAGAARAFGGLGDRGGGAHGTSLERADPPENFRAGQRGLVRVSAGSALALVDLLGGRGQDLVQIAHHAEVDELEDRGFLVLVDGHDRLGGLHAGAVLDRTGDAVGDVELRGDGLAGLADLEAVRDPAGVDGSPRGADRRTERTNVTVLGVPNEYFGGDVSVAGLLTGGDFVAARPQVSGDFVIIPKVALKSDEPVMLDGMRFEELCEKFDVPVYAHDFQGLASMIANPN